MTPQVEKRLQELAREHDGTLTSTFALMEEVADSFRRERDELAEEIVGREYDGGFCPFCEGYLAHTPRCIVLKSQSFLKKTP
jgi:hypothetical protein